MLPVLRRMVLGTDSFRDVDGKRLFVWRPGSANVGIRFVVIGDDIEADGDGAGGSVRWVWIRLGFRAMLWFFILYFSFSFSHAIFL